MSDSEPGSGGAAPAFNSQPSATPSTLSDASTPSQQLGLPSSDSNLASTATPPPDAASATSTASTSSSSSSTPGATIASTSLTSRLLGVPDTLKVIVHFRAVGDAPQLKKSKFMLSASYRFIVLIDFLRKHLHYKPTDTLFLFCNASFSPSPDALIHDLFRCFQLNNELVINYATQDAWG